jgi:hypothetical protein
MPAGGGRNKLDATYRRDADGRWRWLVGCFSIKCPTREVYLEQLAAAVGAKPWQILDDPPRWLGHLEGGGGSSARQPAPLPSLDQIERRTRRLLNDREARRYLEAQRGLSAKSIAKYRLGLDRGAIAIPIFDGNGRLLNVRRRYLTPDRDGPKIVGLRGRGSQLYPAPIPTGSAVLAEGELDALLAVQHGLPAVSSTAGTHWSESWNALVAGKHVAIVYDAGDASFRRAEERASTLRTAGAADAWPVDLRLAGLDEDEDLTDWFVNYRFSSRQLIRLIRQARSEQ